MGQTLQKTGMAQLKIITEEMIQCLLYKGGDFFLSCDVKIRRKEEKLCEKTTNMEVRQKFDLGC